MNKSSLLFFLIFFYTCSSATLPQADRRDSKIATPKSELSISKAHPILDIPINAAPWKENLLRITLGQVINPQSESVILQVYAVTPGLDPIFVGSFSLYPVDQPSSYDFNVKSKIGATEQLSGIRIKLVEEEKYNNEFLILFENLTWVKAKL